MTYPRPAEEVEWHVFKYVYFSRGMDKDVHDDIVTWIRESGYDTKVFSGMYGGMYIHATNDEDVAAHFRLMWITKIKEPLPSFVGNGVGAIF